MTALAPPETSAAPRADRGDSDRLFVLVLAVALTVLGAIRPVTVDDPAYLRQAAWWSAHPLDPLGGEAPLHQELVPARQVAAPPVAVGWLAIGWRITGGATWPAKLWMFPFAWLLAWSLARLLSRAAPGTTRAWLAAIVLSPAMLPSTGFMLEVPMLALATASLAVFALAADGRGARAAVAAGALAGLALQAKYAAAPVLVALVGWGMAAGRPGAGVLAVGAALATFGAIEGAMLALAGSSPLFAYLTGRGARDPAGHAPLLTAWRLVTMAGTAAPALLPLGLTALGAPRRLVRLALAAVVAGFGALALAPRPVIAALDGATGGRWINFENVTIAWMGPALLLVAAALVARGVAVAREPGDLPARALAAWLVAECLLAPFVSASASVRRLLGAFLAVSLLAARLARDAVRREPARRADVAAGAAASVALGLLFWGADVDSALAERRALALALERIGASGDRHVVAVVGDHWSAFQHEAERQGLRKVWLGRSRMTRGDWLIVPGSVGGRSARPDASRLALADSVPLPQRGPLTTRRGFYDGRVALRRADPSEVGARLWRVTEDGEVLRPGGPR